MAEEIVTATEPSMQDITGRLEDALYPSENEPDIDDTEVVSEDAEELPEDDDASVDDDEGSEIDDLDLDAELSLSELLGVDDDRIVMEDGVASVNAIIDGKTTAVPLTELVSSYQLQGHVNNKSMSLQNDRKAFEDERTNVANQLKTRVDGILSLGKAMEQQLVSEYNSIDWDSLRHNNPSEWSALRQDYADKANEIQKSQSLAEEESKRLMAEQQSRYNAQMQERLQSELDKVIEANPDWADENKRASAQSKLAGFMKESYGFGDEDIAVVADHRIINLIQDAMAYREGKQVAEKKVKVVPKFSKPGITKQKSAQLAKARDTKKKRAAVKKTGKTRDIANLIIDRM